jgi:hypothetical protein
MSRLSTTTVRNSSTVADSDPTARNVRYFRTLKVRANRRGV